MSLIGAHLSIYICSCNLMSKNFLIFEKGRLELSSNGQSFRKKTTIILISQDEKKDFLFSFVNSYDKKEHKEEG